MKLCFIYLMWLMPLVSNFSDKPETMDCDCPSITGLQMTGVTSSAVTYAWSGSQGATQYKVWFSRQEDNFTSDFFYTTANSHTFSSLPSGTYTFFFAVICGDETSGFIGVEDIVSN